MFAESGLDGFQAHETSRKLEPLPAGPLAPLMEALHKLKAMQRLDSPVRVRLGLFTARSAPCHERAIRTLMHRGIHLDEAAFLGGCEKGPFLRVFDPDFFFDDQAGHIASAEAVTAAGHVPYGVRNQARRTIYCGEHGLHPARDDLRRRAVIGFVEAVVVVGRFQVYLARPHAIHPRIMHEAGRRIDRAGRPDRHEQIRLRQQSLDLRQMERHLAEPDDMGP